MTRLTVKVNNSPREEKYLEPLKLTLADLLKKCAKLVKVLQEMQFSAELTKVVVLKEDVDRLKIESDKAASNNELATTASKGRKRKRKDDDEE